jgi:type II secretory pathway pseudopilin PulG
VELLIVVVVIGILAAISAVAYAGITQKAKNTAIINAVNQTMKSIQLYIAQEGTYPMTASPTNMCITTESACVFNTGTVITANTTLINNLSKVASVPRSIPISGDGSGITYNYNTSRKYNDELQPVLLAYWLYGANQKCGVSGVMSSWGGATDTPAVTPSTGYTNGNNPPTGKTMCFVSVPGPSV